MSIDFAIARLRSRLFRQIRDFFDTSGFLEVETPSLSSHLIPESEIKPFRTQMTFRNKINREAFLIPSPEVYMKRLLAQGSPSIYQISRSYRNQEEISPLHSPEFALLEWYQLEADYRDNIRITEELFREVIPSDAPSKLLKPFTRLSIEEAFRQFAGFSLEEHLEHPALYQKAEELGTGPLPEDSTADLFHRIFLMLVEPRLPRETPLVLIDYPAIVPTTARKKPGTPWSERWELYLDGVEIANCYSEETDPEKIKEYYSKQNSLMADYSKVADPEYPAIFDHFPRCSGNALGLDRLLMLISGKKSIEGVILFPFYDNVF